MVAKGVAKPLGEPSSIANATPPSVAMVLAKHKRQAVGEMPTAIFFLIQK